MWVIAFAVIGLGSLFFAFVLEGELETALNNEEIALQQVEEIRAENDNLRTELRDEANAVGFAPENGNRIDLEMVTATMNELVTAFGVDGANIDRLSQVVEPIIAVYQGVVGERDDLKNQVTALRNDVAAKEAANRAAMADKDATIATLRTEKEDLASSSQQQIRDLERQRDGLREEFRDLERENAEMRTRHAEELGGLRGEMAILQQRNDILSSRLNAVARRAQTADGSILSVSGEISRAWIDLGSSKRMVAGMEFDVKSPTTGQLKGRLRVINVSEFRSEAEILEQTDRYDPIRTDDVVFNPVYDPNRKLIAVLLGNGFGRYNANDMKSMLSEIGVEVREEVSVETDLLLLGTAFFDDETGEMIPWESRDEYKAANSFSVNVVPLRDWTQWLGV